MSQPAAPSRHFSAERVLLVLFVAVVGTMCAVSPYFRVPQNLLETTRYLVEPGIVALAMTLVIITGGIDLSVGSVVGLSAVFLGMAWKSWGLPVGAAVGVAIAAGAVCGLINGVMVVAFRIPPLIVTLATMAVFRGLATGLSHGTPVSGFPESLRPLGQGYYAIGLGLQLPGQAPILAVLAVLAWVFLSHTRHGRCIYAIGLNETAARYAALPVDRVKIAVYTLSGCLAGLASSVLVSRVATAKPDAGLGFELDVITACVAGGVSITGGRGTVPGAMLGLGIVGCLRRGLELTPSVTSPDVAVIIGLVLVLAVFAHQVLAPLLANRMARGREPRPVREEAP